LGTILFHLLTLSSSDLTPIQNLIDGTQVSLHVLDIHAHVVEELGEFLGWDWDNFFFYKHFDEGLRAADPVQSGYDPVCGSAGGVGEFVEAVH
jgi:hypothetical protein